MSKVWKKKTGKKKFDVNYQYLINLKASQSLSKEFSTIGDKQNPKHCAPQEKRGRRKGMKIKWMRGKSKISHSNLRGKFFTKFLYSLPSLTLSFSKLFSYGANNFAQIKFYPVIFYVLSSFMTFENLINMFN
jgi:hypothetical protein